MWYFIFVIIKKFWNIVIVKDYFKEKNTLNYKSAQKNILKSTVIGIICGSVFCVILMFLSSSLIVKAGGISQNYIYPIITFYTALSALSAGFISGKFAGKNGLLVGTASGMGLFFLILIGSFIVVKGAMTISTLTKLITVVISGALGGVLGVNKA